MLFNSIEFAIFLPIVSESFVTEFNQNTIDYNDKIKIDMLCQKFDIQYFDFSNSIKDVSYFFDADHLNKKGAKEYSNTLNKIINNMDKDL